jgi:hypothetical protein
MGKSFVTGLFGWILLLWLAAVPGYVLSQTTGPDSVFSYRHTTQGLAKKWLKKVQGSSSDVFWVNGVFQSLRSQPEYVGRVRQYIWRIE